MNMCSVRQRPMPWAPNSRAFAASSGVSAFARTFRRRTASAQPRIVSKCSLICGGTSSTSARITSPVPPSIVRRSPSESFASPIVIVREPRSTLSASQPATHGLPIPRATTAACEVMPPCAVRHAARLDQPVDVVGRRLAPDEDHVLPGLAPLLGGVGVERDLPLGRARRGVQALRGDLVGRLRVDHRVQELVELRRLDARDRVVAADQALVDHVGRDPQRRAGRPLAAARLEDVEPPLLDGELDVLHLAVVLLEAAAACRRSSVYAFGSTVDMSRDRLGRADAGDDVLPLRVREELAAHARLARRRIAREADAGARTFASVAEDHLDDVHRRAEVVGDAVRAPVHLGARRLPRVEDGADRALELHARILREVLAGALAVERRGSGRRGPGDRRRSGRRPGFTPRSDFSRSSASSNCSPPRSATTSPYIWTSRRYAS